MISFDLSDEQKMLADTAARYARDRVRPLAREADETGTIPPELIDTAWGLGFIPGSIPETYGGWGERSALNGALFFEELACGDLSVALAAMAPALVAFPVLSDGSAEQKARWLARCCENDYPHLSAALLEPSYQFDLNQLATTAVREGDEYVLEGTKCNVPLAADAEALLVYAHDPEQGGPQGFLIEKGTPGLSVGQREQNMGIKALPTYGISLNGCRVATGERLGGDAGANYDRLTNYSRVGLASAAVGVARAAFEFARDYAKERRQFGEPIASRQAIAFMLAEMAVDIDAARLMLWEAAWKLDRGEDAIREAYLAKLFSDDVVLKVADGAVQALGGYGYIRDYPVEMWLRNSRGFVTFDGLATV